MKGPLYFRFKLLGDARDFPVKAFIDIRKGGITHEDIAELSKVVQQNAAHLVLIITDRSPSSEVLEELETLPQILITTIEQRDMVKLLVISLAKKRGEDIDKNLLQRAYTIMFEKFGLREQILKWLERMSEKGYILDFEGFVDRSVNACRFFINSLGKTLTLEDCWKQSWAIRDLLPFGIDSRIIPDMGLGELEKHARILKNYGFLEERKGKYYLRIHTSEDRIIDLLDRHDGACSKNALINNFIFKEMNVHLFDSLLEHMERKLVISREHRDLVHYLSLADIRKLRDDTVKLFEQRKLVLEGVREKSFAHIVTWKEPSWSLIDIKLMEKTIEDLLSEISTATEEGIIRSRTFLVCELIDWYLTYIDKLTLAVSKSNELINNLELDIGNLEQRTNKVIENLVRATKATNLKVELQELQKARNDLNEIKSLVYGLKSLPEIEEMLKPIAGEKKAKDSTRKEKLATDIDEIMKNRGVRGDWSIAKYVLVTTQVREVRNEIQGLGDVVTSLDNLSNDLVQIAEEIPKYFQETPSQKPSSNLKFATIFMGLSRRIADGVVRKSPFPLNVRTVTVTELQESMKEHVEILRGENEKAKSVKSSIESLRQNESLLHDQLQRITLLERLYEEFWEDKVSDSLKKEYGAICQAYEGTFQELNEEVENFSDFSLIRKKCDQIRQQVETWGRKAQETLNRFKELFDDIKNYIKAGTAFVERLRKNVVPKITKSDSTKINDILNELDVLYEWMSTWIDVSVKQVLEKTSFPEIPNNRTIILNEELKLRESLIHEIKDLEAEETSILLELIKLSSTRRHPIPLSEASEIIGRQMNIDQEKVKKLFLTIADKGFLALAITF